ncbi:MipA/OmpV family protein [Pleionea sp. CnH1-48]|uniref:MipA/OmpV family protein n=1 Tax=Pleionea sp. CnH1-48 TaxID=2954494 RepID=UPI0020980985|nr:MipA/OmpV family protein [Pleionea sp. CnH1-48]MCO7226697.1 MipA/OmpV family protein [Pleionea sp. CnH1-48]
MKPLTLFASLLFSTLAVNSHANASLSEDEALLEIGVSVATVYVPHYEGSDQTKTVAFPFPYLVYKSNKFSFDQTGAKRHLIESDTWELDYSFWGTFPIESEENDARKGMPDLDWLIQTGPAINYKWIHEEGFSATFEFPLRIAITTDFSYLDYSGWQLSPTFRTEKDWYVNGDKWQLTTITSLYHSNKDFHDFYYSVAPDFATTERPAYEADRGFGGYQFIVGLTYRSGDFWVGTFARHRSLENATFIDSPLVRQKDNVYVGLAVAWVFESAKL